MPLTLPTERPNLPEKLQKSYQRYIQLVKAINEKDVPDDFASEVNRQIEELNKVPDGHAKLRKLIRKTRSSITNKVINELKYVPKGYYQVLWMTLGMTIFGVPFGMMFGYAMDNFGLFAVGLPMGLPIGMAIGAGLDKKAADEGRQLAVSAG